ncbi:putative DNA-binding domain-containing protein [Ramlibacter ginsenosidimutans]|uniref:DNA-binding domain-containing protein n=1 Tax=Ramlibacter ginsenosidimutans TaxID=502333 RepID=A0A934TTK3_9BURK|nr:DNA-binding domain-containing protein [Ramlibacter ginsenosidimutans]MBK6007317.1 putative DNA-binding domain-containing protein [Ramlibacter ginsenosidimutans]
MPALLELQHAMHARLAGVSNDDAPAWIQAPAAEVAERLAVYRGTVLDTLVRALRLSHPTVHRLVGDAFFHGAGRLFAQQHLPASADLDRYGDGFSQFLQDFAPCATLTYVPDVARLDRAVHRALHAEDAEPLAFGALAAAAASTDPDRLRFVAHPSVSLLCSPFPVDAIWRAVLQQDDDAMAAVDLDSGPVHLIVERVAGSVEVTRIAASEWPASQCLLQGRPLAELLDAPGAIDIPDLLARHFRAGRLVAFATHPPEGDSP